MEGGPFNAEMGKAKAMTSDLALPLTAKQVAKQDAELARQRVSLAQR